MSRLNVSQIRRVIAEELARVDEIYGSTHLRDRDLDRRSRYQSRGYHGEYTNQPNSQFLPDPVSVRKVQKNLTSVKQALVNVAKAYTFFRPSWYGTLCDSPQTAELAELTLDIGEVIAALAQSLHLKLRLESIIKGVPENILVERGFFDMFGYGSEPKRLGGIRSRKLTPNMIKQIEPRVRATQIAISNWLSAYYALPRLRRWSCTGRAGDRLATALEMLDKVLLDL